MEASLYRFAKFDISCKNLFNFANFYVTCFLSSCRGCSFLSKTIHAEQAGALLAIIMDNEVGNNDRMIDMIEDGTDRTTKIPSFFMLGKDG